MRLVWRFMLLLLGTCWATSLWLTPTYADEAILPALPGGGAGVFGEGNVSVEMTSGVLRTAIPFLLPAARGAVQPQLALSYSSASGPSEAGTGWGLNLPSIERKPLSGAPLFTRLHDRMAFSGQPLVRICGIPAS